MMPWDMLVTVNGYWDYKFRNTTLDDLTYLPLNSRLAYFNQITMSLYSRFTLLVLFIVSLV